MLPSKVKPLSSYSRETGFPPGISWHKEKDKLREQGLVAYKFRWGYYESHDPINPTRYIRISDYTDDFVDERTLAWSVFDKVLVGEAKFSSGEPLGWDEKTHLFLFDKKERELTKPEQNFKQVLEELNINYNIQVKFKWAREGYKNYRYDFELTDYGVLVEVDGKQHKKSVEFFGGDEQLSMQKYTDGNKERLAVENGYYFLRISFDQIDSSKKILTDFLKSVIFKEN